MVSATVLCLRRFQGYGNTMRSLHLHRFVNLLNFQLLHFAQITPKIRSPVHFENFSSFLMLIVIDRNESSWLLCSMTSRSKINNKKMFTKFSVRVLPPTLFPTNDCIRYPSSRTSSSTTCLFRLSVVFRPAFWSHAAATVIARVVARILDVSVRCLTSDQKASISYCY
jgi:hypothetical protein